MQRQSQKQKLKEKPIQLKMLLIIACIVTIIINWGYGNSYYIYLVAGIFVGLFTYINFVDRKPYRFCRMESVVLICVIISLAMSLTSFINGNDEAIKSMILLNVSLLFPYAISFFNINFDDEKKQLKQYCVFAVILSLFLFLTPENWNSNGLAILLFSILSYGFILFKLSKKAKDRLFTFAGALITIVMMLTTGSRNAGLNILVFFALSCFLLSRNRNHS